MTGLNGYWLASSVAQCSSALMGLLVAAYAFLLQFSRESDTDSRDDFRQRNHRTIVASLVLLGLSVLSAVLAMALLRGESDAPCALQALMLAVAALGLLATVVIVVFIVGVRLAPKSVADIEREIEQEVPTEDAISADGKREFIDPGDFLEAYIPIERRLREMAEKAGLGRASAAKKVRLLATRKLIAGDLAHQLLELVDLRNRVIHGEVDNVPESARRWAQRLLGLLPQA